VVLFSSGSQGIGLSEPVLRELTALTGATVLVVCGKDEDMKQKLEVKFVGTAVLPLGYYTPMDDLYAISDVFVTKPGGLTVAESLRAHLPMVIFYVLPGGEPLNYQYLLKRGLILEPGVSLTATVKHELQTGEARTALLENPEISRILPDPSVLVSAVSNVLQNRDDQRP
jgi:processive 1,2-diacylglycerol beta-glucosyltransferase